MIVLFDSGTSAQPLFTVHTSGPARTGRLRPYSATRTAPPQAWAPVSYQPVGPLSQPLYRPGGLSFIQDPLQLPGAAMEMKGRPLNAL